MRVCGIRIQNYRSIEDADITLGDTTRIIGANGAGKSTILKALELFYAGSPSTLSADDFFCRDQSREIAITIRFHKLDARETKRFERQVKPDGKMTVTRVFTSDTKKSGKYYGNSLRAEIFAGIRAVEPSKQRRDQYKLIQEARPELNLPNIARAEDIEPVLQAWEQANQSQCVEMRDDGQFFGFQNVGTGKLNDCTALVYIPAVRDASADTTDGKNSAVSRLLELVVRSAIERRPDIKKFKDDTIKAFNEIMNPDKLTELSTLSTTLSTTLAAFYSDTSVLLKWGIPQPPNLQFPPAEMALIDDGFQSPVDRTGHGLQRALIMTLLQHLAVAIRTQAPTENDAPQNEGDEPLQPSLVLAIEEPELYQHPTKQRHFCNVLDQLSSGTLLGAARDTQVIFTTHSPHFVAMEKFEDVRIVKRQRGTTERPRYCEISTPDLNQVAKKLAGIWGRPESDFTAASLKPRLHILDGSVAEGFFASVAVLVEGVNDRAALLAAASYRQINLAAQEIEIVPVGGKSNLDRPYLIFRELGIPTFVLWDNDKSKPADARLNRKLQMMLGRNPEKIEDSPVLLEADHACFEEKLENTIKDEIGAALWDELLDDLRNVYEAKTRDDAQKIPQLMTDLLSRAAEKGKRSQTLDTIIDNIVALKKSSAESSADMSRSSADQVV